MAICGKELVLVTEMVKSVEACSGGVPLSVTVNWIV